MCCDQFYKMAQHEFAMTQYTLDRHSSQLQVLERAKANKTILLLDLPPIFNKKTLDANVGYYLQAAGLQWDQVAAMHNHMVSSASSLIRLEFLTEQQAAQFRDQMRQGRRYWRDPQQQDHKIRIEQDQPLENRLAMQPYYALLDVLAELYVAETGDDTHSSLQTWRQTLQIWTAKGVEPKQLIGQVIYALDPHFARRYSCLLLVHDRFYDALKRATSDHTTAQRASYDKAFDLTTASHAQAFPYTVMPVRISDDLASTLESHSMLPFQGAGGMTALTAQAFLDQGFEDYGKGTNGLPRWAKAAATDPFAKDGPRNPEHPVTRFHVEGHGPLEEHRKYWSTKQAQDSWTSLPTATKCMVLQLDRILFDLDPIMQEHIVNMRGPLYEPVMIASSLWLAYEQAKQAPNDQLVKLLEYILPLMQISTQEVQAVQWRAHVNKGNIMETLMLALAEGGAHLLAWRTAWSMLQHQHKDTRYSWVQVVSVY
ncbi:YGR125W [Symbiodinium sp. CCMP2592]|nr:YGR125W [Symbiodinium sp. CCMP2592]